MKFSGGVGRNRRKNRLNFSGDSNSFVEWIIFQGSSSLRDRTYPNRYCHLSNVYELVYATQLTLASSSSLASAEVRALYRVLSS